jgi:carbohydrate-selective porin OprB
VTQARLAAGNETVVETFYKLQATKRVFVQPDIQWFNRPSGNGRNVLLGGLRVGIAF